MTDLKKFNQKLESKLADLQKTTDFFQNVKSNVKQPHKNLDKQERDLQDAISKQKDKFALLEE